MWDASRVLRRRHLRWNSKRWVLYSIVNELGIAFKMMWCVSTHAAPCHVIAQAGMWHAPLEVEVDVVGFSVLEWPAGALELRGHWTLHGISLEYWSDFFSHGLQPLSDASTFLTSSSQVLAKLQSIWAACIEHQLQPNASPWLSSETQAVNFTKIIERGYAHGHEFIVIHAYNFSRIIFARMIFGRVPRMTILIGPG